MATCCVAGAGQVKTDVALQVMNVCEKAEGAVQRHVSKTLV